MATMRELLTGSLRLLNVVQSGEAPTSDDMNVALRSFNTMLDGWSAERLGIYSVRPYYFNLVADQQDYTLGTGGDFDVPRPMQILQAVVSYGSSLVDGTFTSNPSSVDIPIELLNDAQYAAIPVKSTTSTYPNKVYDNGNFPLRTLSFWPVPNQVQPITLWLWEPLASGATLDDEVNLPKGYERALRFNLAVELAPEFGKQLTDTVIKTAIQSKAVIKRLNSHPQIMVGDIAVAQPGSGIFTYLTATSTGN